jgi:hypothetical protein
VGRAARRRRRKFKEICALENFLSEQQQQQQRQQINQPQQQKDVEEAAATSSATGIHVKCSINTSNVLPMDRDRIWPAVIELRNSTTTGSTISKWTKEDNMALKGQLGYVPGNAIQVVCRMKDLLTDTNFSMSTNTSDHLFHQQSCSLDNDSPVVIQLYPIVYRNPHSGGKAGGKQFKLRKRQKLVLDINDETSLKQPKSIQEDVCMVDPMLIEPFPTIYWLTHPLLRCIVSKLELEGYGMQLERRLQSDTAAVRMMQLAHEAYGQERYSYLSASDLQLIQSYQWEKAFATSRGIAGISNNSMAVKCLHAHLAHYLSNSTGSQHNVVGRWVWEEMRSRSTFSLSATSNTVSDKAATSLKDE